MKACRTHGATRSRVRLLLVVVAIGLVGVAGCSSGGGTPAAAPPSSAPAPSAPVSSAPLAAAYHSPDGYSVSPPDGWVLHPTDGQNGVSVVFAAPALDQAAKKPFVDNLNVVITPTGDTLDNLIAKTKQQYPSVLTNYKVVTDQPATVNGHARQARHLVRKL